ncbi:MAG: class I SAM-dependent methyltransferase [Rhodospirillales bacterium]|nr:class I SAM-dependent methyltransferase [Rhodospirillales bacterium]
MRKKYSAKPTGPVFVPETRFGVWFLGTEVWVEHVLDRAIKDLERLIENQKSSYPVILDVGCGWGRSFKILKERFSPQRMIGVDVNPNMLAITARQVSKQGIDVDLIQGTSCCLAVADQSVDIIFCHQTFHHLVNQELAIREFYRVLKPGGLLLFAESTRAYIYSWTIRYLFRHPMDMQKSASEYLTLIKSAGFRIGENSISLPYLWWSRPELGIVERWFGGKPSEDHEETLINVVAVRE